MFNRIDKLTVAICLALAAGTVFIYFQVHNFDFTNYDDNIYVSENQHVLTGLNFENIKWAFTTPQAGNWLPLTFISFMVDCWIFGANPGWIHLVNVLLHIANALLLFLILRNMTGQLWPSAFVAAAFAFHPMHVESVAWITERKDVLSTLFFLLTLAAYVGYVNRRGLFRYCLTLLLFACGLLAKPMLVTVPFVLLLLDYWPLNRFAPANKKTAPQQSLKFILAEKIPFLGLAVISSIITFMAQESSGSVPSVNTLNIQGRIADAFLSYATYIGKMFWPTNLAVIYPLNITFPGMLPVVFCTVLVLGISLIALYFVKTQKYLFVGWFWFVITLLPVIGLVQSGPQAYADRYTYIPYIGLFIMAAWGLPQLFSKLPHKKIVLGTSTVAALTILGICSYRQVSFWKNSSTLFSHAVDVTQDNFIAYDQLARFLHSQGNNVLAIENYKKALQIAPDYLDTLFGIGCSFADQGNSQQAIEYFEKLLQLGPHSGYAAHAHVNLGAVFRRQGKFKEAIEQFNEALQISPDMSEAHYEFAVLFFLQGKTDESLNEFRTAIRLNPYWAEPMNDLAGLMATHPEIKSRNIDEAVRLAIRACELTNYNNPSCLATLATAYAASGRFAEAIAAAKKAAALADAAGQQQIKNAVQHHLSFYLQNKPYVEPPLRSAAR